jgi:hypothetical protein
MATRSRRETITFRHTFRIRGIERLLPPGLSFQAWRRVATMITAPAKGMHGSAELLSIGSVDLADAQREASAAQ